MDRLAQRVAGVLDAERENLPLWLPVALGAGIAAWFLLPWETQRLGLAVALVGAGLSLALLGRRSPAVLALVMAGGMAAAEWRSTQVAHVVLPARTVAGLTAQVVAVEPRQARDQLRLMLDVEAWDVPDPRLPSRVRLTLRGAAAERTTEQPGFGVGARLQARAMLSPPAGPAMPGGHDMARALWFEGVGATGLVAGDPHLLAPARAPERLMAWLAEARLALSARIRAAVPGDAGAVAAVFVTGERGAVPLDTAEAVRNAGLAHLLSISGLHIAVVVGGVILLVRRLLGLWPWLALRLPVRTLAMAVAALAGLGYTLLAGSEVPTVRSMIATLIVLLGLLAGREAISLRLLAAAAFAILLVRPEVLLGPSFQMSFAAVGGIIALYESAWGKRLLAPRENGGWFVSTLPTGLLALLATGLVAEMVLAPIGLFHFQQAGLYGVAANLLAIPLTSFGILPALGLGMVGDALGLGAAAYAPAGWLVSLLLKLAAAVANTPGAVARLPIMPDLGFAALVAGGLWLMLWRTRLRLLGVPLIVTGIVIAIGSPPADVLVSRDGRHVALRLPDGELAFLRPRAGVFLRDSWGGALAAKGEGRSFDQLPGMRCSRDACFGPLQGARGGQMTLLATRSRDWLAQADMAPACAAADIVVSERQLPDWCRPRWLRLGHDELERRGAVAIWLDRGKLVGTRDKAGDRPWG
ncbi:ComEC/Rec2 family competence protein [Polymorphobacter sp.]|uniref:ComEC/Rec2 family competence protein n=1 Tax=Polymorphobacter sp. TaxID=1909290 RepID=UPI003F6EB494